MINTTGVFKIPVRRFFWIIGDRMEQDAGEIFDGVALMETAYSLREFERYVLERTLVVIGQKQWVKVVVGNKQFALPVGLVFLGIARGLFALDVKKHNVPDAVLFETYRMNENNKC